jgi:hypothetical protein
MQCGYPVRCRRAIIADLPLVGQLGHREQLVFDPAKIARLDLVMPADTSCRQTTGSNPAADRLRVPPDLLGGFGNRQHLDDCRRGCGPHQTAPCAKPGLSGAMRSCAAGGVSLTYASVRGRSLNPSPTSQISHPPNQYRPSQRASLTRPAVPFAPRGSEQSRRETRRDGEIAGGDASPSGPGPSRQALVGHRQRESRHRHRLSYGYDGRGEHRRRA